jgi:GT2 family glycosyltransferase
MKILIICVNYNSDKETLIFAEDVFTQSSECDVDLVVVDNSVATGSNYLETSLSEASKNHAKKVFYFRASRNLGYFGAARFGLYRYLLTNSMPEWVIISNVDIKFSSNDFLFQLTNKQYGDSIAAVAPSIISGIDGRDQNPLMACRPHRSKMLFYKCIYGSVVLVNVYQLLSVIKNWLRIRFGSADKKPSPLKIIYAPHGSFIIINKRYFEMNGDLNFPGFLFGEEIFVAESARSLGLNIVYDPSLQLQHNEHMTTGIFWSRPKARYQFASIKYLSDHYFKNERKAKMGGRCCK